MSERCLECGAVQQGGRACQDDFHQMLAWEYDDPSIVREVHHLMVLGYYLQHPSLYSPEGLRGAKLLLVDFVERGLMQDEVRRRDRAKLDSGKRAYKIGGTPGAHGSYAAPTRWPMTAADIIAGGPAHYCENVRAWSQSILQALRASSNLS